MNFRSRGRGGVWGGNGRARSICFQNAFARRAQEGAWGGNAHALAFCGRGGFYLWTSGNPLVDIIILCKLTPQFGI